MKLTLWVLLGFGVTGLLFWLIASGSVPKSPVAEALVIAVFSLPSVGAFWMLYMAVRYESRPIRYIALAFIPYTFMWYYFHRVKPRRYGATQQNPD